MELWKNLLPMDRYTVRANGILHAFDLKVLTYLYQPLIGATAKSIYHTLSQELYEGNHIGDVSTHHVFMTRVNLTLKQFYQERRKLEAIGLLKSYQKSTTDDRHYIYELQPPLTPQQFFDDGMLNIYLFNRIGKSQYQRLKQLFSIPMIEEDYEEVTTTFNDVFTSVQPSELMVNGETAEVLTLSSSNQWLHREQQSKLPFYEKSFNFDLLYQHLSNVILPEEAFTQDVKDVIVKLAFVYHLEPQEMGHIIQRAFLHDTTIDISKLRKEVQKYYRIEVGKDLPVLSERKQPIAYQEMNNKQPANEEDKLIAAFEQMSPYDLLGLLADGAKPTAPDLKVIEEILFEQKLNPGVINVLIHYVMETNDQKLVKAYIEKIAGQWARKKIKTVREAMTIARSEHRKYQSWSDNNRRSSYKNKSPKNQRQQKLPKWMTEEESQQNVSEIEAQKQQEWLENYLEDL